jgi:hypothetical protein
MIQTMNSYRTQDRTYLTFWSHPLSGIGDDGEDVHDEQDEQDSYGVLFSTLTTTRQQRTESPRVYNDRTARKARVYCRCTLQVGEAWTAPITAARGTVLRANLPHL